MTLEAYLRTLTDELKAASRSHKWRAVRRIHAEIRKVNYAIKMSRTEKMFHNPRNKISQMPH